MIKLLKRIEREIVKFTENLPQISKQHSSKLNNLFKQPAIFTGRKILVPTRNVVVGKHIINPICLPKCYRHLSISLATTCNLFPKFWLSLPFSIYHRRLKPDNLNLPNPQYVLFSWNALLVPKLAFSILTSITTATTII